jgi:membrane protease YdiL (CAAX protease family)
VTLCLLASVWCLLLLGAALAPWLGADAARLGAYAACAALLVWARRGADARTPVSAALLAGAAGFVALPAWLLCVWLVGAGAGLAAPPRGPGAAPGLLLWLANVALAPLFEELLYRERLLPALRARLGAPLAILLSSAAFAAPHLEAWQLLASFAVGLALGGVFLATGRVALCVAYHAGLNAAALWCGLPPQRAALAPLDAALAGALLLAAACLCTSVGRSRTRVHAGRALRARAGGARARRLHRSRAWRRSASDS